jgi:hypothetical protein
MPAIYFPLLGSALLVTLVIWRTRAMNRRFAAEDYFSGEGSPLPSEPDHSCVELGPKIFDLADSDFVMRETSPSFARRFREERTGLALQWLGQIRRHTNGLMRVHAKSARANADLRVKDEIALFFDFLVFQLTIGILYYVVWLRGPFHAARLVAYSTAVGRRFDDLAQEILPSANPLAAERVAIGGEPQSAGRSTAVK